MSAAYPAIHAAAWVICCMALASIAVTTMVGRMRWHD